MVKMFLRLWIIALLLYPKALENITFVLPAKMISKRKEHVKKDHSIN